MDVALQEDQWFATKFMVVKSQLISSKTHLATV